MKIAGLNQIPKNEKVVPISRIDRVYYFLTYAVEDSELFDTLVPRPQPTRFGGEVGKPKEAIHDKTFMAKQQDYYNKFSDYLVISSLKACAFDQTETDPETGEVTTTRLRTPIVWDKVKIDAPETWSEWEKELKEFGLTPPEVNRIRSSCAEANSLTNEMVEEAMADFLRNPPANTVEDSVSTSQVVLGSTPSGEAAAV